jgi:glutaredoxin
MGKLIAYCKIDCPYSIMTAETLEKIKKMKNSANIEINWVNIAPSDKKSFFDKLNVGDHKTFPVIFYESTQGTKYFIGGNDKFQDIINIIKTMPTTHINNVKSSNGIKLLKHGGERRLYYYLMTLFDKINV